jgi:arabinofuranan 3-O-arabinosyltransferase
VVRVAAAQRSYLVVAENYNTGWQARLAGHILQPVRLDGWQQGWILPAGSRGLVTLTYGPQAQYEAALWGGGFALLAVVIVAFLLPTRRRRTPAGALVMSAPARCGAALAAESSGAAAGSSGAVPATEPPAGATARSRVALGGGLCLTVLFGLWVGGYVGAALLPLLTLGFGVALALRSRSRVARRLTEPVLTVGLMVGAAVCHEVGVQLIYHAGSGNLVRVLSGIIPQLACLIIIGRLAAALLSQPPGPRPLSHLSRSVKQPDVDGT